MINSKYKIIKNIKLISIYIFNKESSIKAINEIYSAVDKYQLKTELIKITSISFSLAVEESENTDLFLESLKDFSEIRIKDSQSLMHIDNDLFSNEMLSEMFTRLNEEELRMVHYRFDSNRVTIISDNDKLDKIYSKISE